MAPPFKPNWSKEEALLFRSSFSSLEFGTTGRKRALADTELKELFDKAMINYIDRPVNERFQDSEDLRDYLEHEYGVDFVEDYDWEGYREWYDGISG